MMTIQEAKRSLGRELRAQKGFVGVGLGRNAIRLYAHEESAPVVKTLRSRWGDTYEGYPVSVVLSPGFGARRQRT